MFDLRRLRGTIVALAILGLTLATCSLVLLTTIGRDPRRFLGSDWPTYTLISYQKAGGRLSGVVREPQNREMRLGVLLGASTLQWGVDVPLLKPPVNDSWRWLSLPGVGSTTADLEGMARLIHRSGLRPDALVLAFNFGMLARSRNFLAVPFSEDRSFDAAALARHLAARRWRPAARELGIFCTSAISGAFPYRTRAHYRVEYGILMTRIWLLEALGQENSAVFAPTPRPWLIDEAPEQKVHLAKRSLMKQMNGLKERGWFDPMAYDPAGGNAAALVRLIQEARSRKVPVAIVLMPESTRARRVIPIEAERCFSGALSRAFGANQPPVLDLRRSIPDHLFYDSTHLDVEGKHEFTRRLSVALGDQLTRLEAAPRDRGLVARNRN